MLQTKELPKTGRTVRRNVSKEQMRRTTVSRNTIQVRLSPTWLTELGLLMEALPEGVTLTHPELLHTQSPTVAHAKPANDVLNYADLRLIGLPFRRHQLNWTSSIDESRVLL